MYVALCVCLEGFSQCAECGEFVEVLATQQGHESQGPLGQWHHIYAFKKIVWEDEAACVRQSLQAKYYAECNGNLHE